MLATSTKNSSTALGQRCQSLLTALLEWICDPEFGSEMSLARDLYALSTGKVNDEDSFYESRMASFLEYFLFDYRLLDVFPGSTLLETYLERKEKIKSDQTLTDVEYFRSSNQSLYLTQKIFENKILVFDLIKSEKRMIFGLPDVRFSGIDPRLLFTGRTIRFHQFEFFTNSFIFHPVECTNLIKKQVKIFVESTCRKQLLNPNNWIFEREKRKKLLSSSEERLAILEQAQKTKSVELLRATGNLARLAPLMDQGHLIMSLGQDIFQNPFVPEAPLYDTLSFLHKLAYCEVKSARYKHIGPEKVYAQELRMMTQGS